MPREYRPSQRCHESLHLLRYDTWPLAIEREQQLQADFLRLVLDPTAFGDPQKEHKTALLCASAAWRAVNTRSGAMGEDGDGNDETLSGGDDMADGLEGPVHRSLAHSVMWKPCCYHPVVIPAIDMSMRASTKSMVAEFVTTLHIPGIAGC